MMICSRIMDSNSCASSNNAGTSKLSRFIKKVNSIFAGSFFDGYCGRLRIWVWVCKDNCFRRSLAVLCSPIIGENNWLALNIGKDSFNCILPPFC